MQRYEYQYIDGAGKKKKGRLEATHIQEARDKLRSQKYVIVNLQEAKKGIFNTHKPALSKESLIAFTSQLSQLLMAGIPLYESLLSLQEAYRNESSSDLFSRLCEKIKEGSSLSRAMEEFPDCFSPLFCSMVAAGESIGALDKALLKLSTLLNKQNKIKKQLLTALIYPSVLFSFSLVVISVLLMFVIPSLENLFEGREVNDFTQALIGVSHFLNRQWMLYIPALIGSIVALNVFFRSGKGKKLMQQWVLSLPIVKKVVVQAAIARFTRTMGSLLEGGVTIIPALQISRKVMHNFFLEKIIEEAEGKIVEGSLLSKELKKSNYFPPLVSRMVSIGEEGGNLEGMLLKIADFYEEEIEKTVTRLTALAQPLILLVMGGIVGLIMLSVLLPLTDINAFL